MRHRRSKVRTIGAVERRLSRYVSARIAEAVRHPLVRHPPVELTIETLKVLCERVSGRQIRSLERGDDGVYHVVLEPEPRVFTFTAYFSRETGETTTEPMP